MPLFILAETSAGYGLFKAKDKKLLDRNDLDIRLSTADKINEELKLKEFVKWDSAASALSEIDKLLDGKVPPILAGLIDKLKDEKKLSLAVADKSLGSAIQKLPGVNITPVNAGPGSTAGEVYRGIRAHMAELIPGIQADGFKTMSLGLSHSLSRHKLKFSADKVDVMVIQAVSLLDDLDKELNTYAMRVKEWYGWHFPELGKILNDNLAFARVILTVGMRENISTSDLSEILPEEIETAVKAAAEVSMGTEIAEEDLENIRLLAEQVVAYSEYRNQLSSYLDSRMKAIAPNLTELVGFLVGARLIAHTGSLMNLAKSAGSTVQILGAEKALFRALKTKHATPKYGLIYHSSLVGQATGKNKGKIARKLSAKAALGVRTDALSDFKEQEEMDDEERAAFGANARVGLENQLRKLEGKPLLPKGASFAPNGVAAPGKWDVKEARKYNIDADGLAGDEPAAAEATATPAKKVKEEKTPKKEKKDKKDKKSKKEAADVSMVDDEDEEMADDASTNGANGTGGKLSEADFEKYAAAAGISVVKFKRKFERGDIKIEGGKPTVFSKKEMKKLRKAEEASSDAEEAAKPSKRKRDEDSEKPKKKKKKSHD